MSHDPKHDRPNQRRRHLLTLGGAASAGLMSSMLSPLQAWAAEPKVPRRTLGKTGKKIPILLLGGGSGFDKNFDPRIGEALRYGVDYVDAARSYAGGQCEPNAANSLDKLGAKDSTWITTKSKEYDPAGFEASVHKSLSELRRNFVDLYFLHQLEDPRPLDDRNLWSVVERLKKEGKIRHFGFSCHDGNVADLLHKAAKLPLVDAVMFRYNFRTYGNAELNRAMDAAHKANVGLIAMKTQGAEASFRDAWEKFETTGKWNKHQAVLKAVWADPRITAAVSHMDNIKKLRENVAAALDKTELGAVDREALERYADATRGFACDGCDHICGAAIPAPVKIGQVMRSVMYHDVYGDADKAQRVFHELAPTARQLAGVEFSGANAMCPNGVDVAAHMRRARELFA